MTAYRDIFRKLKAGPEQSKLLIGAPKAYLEALQEFSSVPVAIRPDAESFAFIQLFVSEKAALEKILPGLIDKLDDRGILWVSYPKKSSGIKTDLSRDEGWEILKKVPFRPVQQVSIDETWSALRLKNKADVQTRKKVNTPYIDHDRRTVTAPPDLLKALEAAGLSEKFHKMSFTHKREYVEAIEEAKKPETRQRRIEKTIEFINQK